jgi:outer membrane protein assembly factor BamB
MRPTTNLFAGSFLASSRAAHNAMTIDFALSPPAKTSPSAATPPRPAPRLWPALALVAAYWVAFATVNVFFPATFTQFLTMFWSPQVLAPAILVWWLFFSRQPWADRLWGVAWLILGGILATLLAHKSMMMGMIMYAAPVAITAVVLTLFAMRNADKSARWISIAAASLLAWHYFALIRVDGVTASLQSERSWRWSPTAEDTFLAQRKKQASESVATASPVQLIAKPTDWPSFRGPNRDGHLHNVSLSADWTAQPPREVWRRRVGPGWSSFAVVGNHVYTQEQRGDAEAVLCFNLASGEEIWSHEDKARFEEVVAGAGPRATPTFDGGRIYALGGGGVLNCLDAATGKKLWSHDIAADWEVKPPQWGFSSSPLVAQGIVSVFAGAGKQGKGVVAYDANTGELRWTAGKATHSYSSPHLLKIGDSEQVLMVSDHGLEAFDAASGQLLWEHEWNLKDFFRVCQPHILGDSQILLGTGMSNGTRLLTLAGEDGKWSVTEGWTSKDLSPYFNDIVSQNGHLYGFDGEFLVCIDAATGKKKWKKRGYGHGQVLLVGESGQMLVISDKGEAALTEVSPNGLTERGKFQALSGKTWNHPVIAGGKLLVRNAEEMACYDVLPTNSL